MEVQVKKSRRTAATVTVEFWYQGEEQTSKKPRMEVLEQIQYKEMMLPKFESLSSKIDYEKSH